MLPHKRHRTIMPLSNKSQEVSITPMSASGRRRILHQITSESDELEAGNRYPTTHMPKIVAGPVAAQKQPNNKTINYPHGTTLYTDSAK